jgi:hypothetical protein
MGVEKMRAISGRKSGPSKRYLILAGAACFLTPLAVHASAILTLNTGLTAPDDNVALYADDATPQTVNVQIAGNDGQNLQGSNLYVQLDDGGPDNSGVDSSPTISSVDMVTNTIFTGHNNGNDFDPSVDLSPDGMVAVDGVNTPNDSTLVSDTSGNLAQISIDTEDFPVGTKFTMSFFDVAAGIFGPPGMDTNIFNASADNFPLTGPGYTDSEDSENDVPAETIELVAVPEPGSLVLLLAGLPMVLQRRRARV